jgi:DNA-binding transcriptional regulator YiaG
MTNIKKQPVERSTGFAEQIKSTIERLQLTDNQAADYLGVPVFTLRKWLTGEREPGAATHKLIEVLGMLEALAPALHESLLPRGKK